MADSNKRKAEHDGNRPSKKKSTGKKGWRPARQGQEGHANQSRNIEPGDSGIWITCNLKKEGKCAAEIKDCFEEYVAKLYGPNQPGASGAMGEVKGDDDSESENDIEAEIKREVQGLQSSASAKPYIHLKLDTNCVVFFRTLPPIEPAPFVHAICKDASENPGRKRSRFIKKLTPMTLMGKATENGLAEVAKTVLAPHFHGDDNAGKKVLSRDGIIRQVAAAVGPGHKVDLKDYDLLILVEVYKNVCGMSVVGNDYEKLRRYNLTEIYEPTPKPKEAAADE